MTPESAAPDREKRDWWYANVAAGEVRRVVGYACGPENQDYWWCPTIGASVCVGFQLFDNPVDARARVRYLLRTEAEDIARRQEKLEAQDVEA